MAHSLAQSLKVVRDEGSALHGICKMPRPVLEDSDMLLDIDI